MILHAIEAGSGPPVILLHGLFGAARNFGAVQKHLARDWRVIALDLRNHGASPHAAETGYDAMADDVMETMRALDAYPAMVLGHSMGGKAAMRAALNRPEAITRLIVADVAPAAYEPHFRSYAQAMLDIPLAPGLTRAEADAALARTVREPGMRAFLLQNLRLGDPPAWRNGLSEIAAGLPAIEGWPDPPPGARYDGPTLFIAGARSDYIRDQHRPVMAALFPHAEYAVVPDAGHWLHADNMSGFLAVLEPFLRA